MATPFRYVTLCCVAFSCVACSGPCAILLPGTSCACAVVDILYTIISNTHQYTHTPARTHTCQRNAHKSSHSAAVSLPPFLSLILTLVWRYFDLCVCACGDFMFYLAFTLPNCCLPPLSPFPVLLLPPLIAAPATMSLSPHSIP